MKIIILSLFFLAGPLLSAEIDHPHPLQLIDIPKKAPWPEVYQCQKQKFIDKGPLLPKDPKKIDKIRLVIDAQGHKFVVKRKLLRWDYSKRNSLQNELSKLQMLKESKSDAGKCVIDLADYYVDEHHIVVILPFAKNGDLFDYIESKNFSINPKELPDLFYQMASSVAFLHENGVAHRDLSLENWFLDVDQKTGQKHLLLGDLEAACGTHDEVELKDWVGKEHYMAPEIATFIDQYSPMATDIWSLGICFYNMKTGLPLFGRASLDDKSYLAFYLHGLRDLLSSKKGSFDEILISLLENMIVVEPIDRFSIAEVLNHRLFDGL